MKVVGFDPFLSAEKAPELRGRERLAARRPLGPLRLHHPAHAPDGRDAEPGRARAARADEADASGSSTAPGAG